MTDIWRKDGEKWSLMGPSKFHNEEELHDRIVEVPEMLPLSGQPQLVAPYREVPLGGGSADVLAFEVSGRPVVIEVKLSQNPEAKRAVIAQTLAYAAGLHGATVEELEEDILGSQLAGKSLADAVEEVDAEGTFDRDEFYANLAGHLTEGSFRLVIVLDDAPAQLVRLTRYLEAITTDRIAVDLITVSAYEVNGAQILLPQRIDPERVPEPSPARSRSARKSGGTTQSVKGSAFFRESLTDLPDERKTALSQLADWADGLVEEGLCRVHTYRGTSGRFTLLMRLPDDDAGFSVLLNDSQSPNQFMTLNRTVIERRAPKSLPRIEAVVAPVKVGRGTAARATPELIEALAEAYREAAGKE